MKNAILRDQRGITLIDMLVVVMLIGIVSAMAIPSITNTIEAVRLGQSVRDVERELQTAKMRAVGKGRPMRVHFDCPATGQYRMVELIGTASAYAPADGAGNRCSEAAYPFPAPDNNPVTRPNLDGPVRRVDPTVTFEVAPTIEFWPDGTAHYNAGGGGTWALIPVAGLNVRLARNGRSSTITVNGLGKVQLQQPQ